MNRSLRRGLRCALVGVMIVSLQTALPPFNAFARPAHDQSRAANMPDAQTFDKRDVSEITLGFARFLPKIFQENDFSSLKRFLAQALTLRAKVCLCAQIKFAVEFLDYFFDNNLRFNLPRFSHRQSPGEHASEG